MSYNQDFKDLLNLLSENQVEFIIIGAYAVIFYTEPRFTSDLDIWINPTKNNAEKIWKTLEEFGAPLLEVEISDFTNPDIIYQIGVDPVRIDVFMGVPGLNFNDSYEDAVQSNYDGIPIRFLSRKDLIKAKKTTKREQDILDIKRLEDFNKNQN